ncbi:MAG: hypothetical protein NT018_00810 [Armatimonadetes bacterium]|nr:hypothetical protein [Armatimonadota bacterium]
MKFLTPIFLLLTAIIIHIAIFRLAPKMGLVKLNYKKTPIMASYGIAAFGYIAAILVALALLGYGGWRETELYLAVMGAMWALGAADDIFGNRDVGGFKGHFKKLLLERQLTTGAFKAIGGGCVGIAAGWFVSGGNPVKWALAALLIPLASNILNLFDLRPGRAVAVFFFGLGVTCIRAGAQLAAPWLIGSIAIVAMAFGVLDSRAKAMMGDSGSNALGAAMGLAMVTNTGIVFQISAIIIIVAIHLYSEKRSVSALIERNPVLKSIDRRLGVR